MIPDKNNAFDYPIGEAIPVTVDDGAFRMTRTLLERIVEAQNIALKEEIEANAVVVNGRKYGMMKNHPGLTPTVFGMRLEIREDMPDDWDFFVQQRPPQTKTNADLIRAMTDEELADLLTAVAKKSAEMLCKSLKTVEVDLSECDFEILTKTHLSWLKAPVEAQE